MGDEHLERDDRQAQQNVREHQRRRSEEGELLDSRHGETLSGQDSGPGRQGEPDGRTFADEVEDAEQQCSGGEHCRGENRSLVDGDVFEPWLVNRSRLTTLSSTEWAYT